MKVYGEGNSGAPDILKICLSDRKRSRSPHDFAMLPAGPFG
ncbi:hypothetical protein SGL43_04644 [Streptomyces globisporus]|uniref:Uncharacterized protein n=1 Tax=Streptomyces globisporus TaxID=1908 RepID=A0ABM9H1W6_STRGL|nr:hypothetical protein SGL43_04644 [Streptomyces globisporus]